MHADGLIAPWYERLREDLPPLELLDAHTHTGQDDPDGFRCTADELLAALDVVDGRGVVFTMHEPSGYRAANDRVLAEAEASGGRLMPLCRVDPASEAVPEAERCLAAGARGIKLHPRAEGFTLEHPAVEGLLALADERRLPVLVHAGRGIPALGRHALLLSERFPGARLILAHAAVSDLSWIWRHAPEHPNLFFDTSWWSPTDLLALLGLVPPGQVLFASDAPYGTPLHSVLLVMRCALQLGYADDQLRALAGGQLERLLQGEDPLDLGPAVGMGEERLDILLERVCGQLYSMVGRLMAGADADELMPLARLACEVGEDAPQSPVCRSVLELLDLHERHAADLTDGVRLFPGVHLVVLALCVARTPDVGVPAAGEHVSTGEREP